VAKAAPSIRLFVAVYPPVERRQEYLDALSRIDPPADRDHRKTPVEQVHLTLQFIGHVQEREVEAIRESIERSVAGVPAFVMTPQRMISLPERRTPRLIAMEFDAPAALMEVRRRLVKRLARDPRREDPERFLPHMTLLRFGGGAHPKRVEQPVELEGFEVREILLMRSVLRPGGAAHSEMERFNLGE
jgi:2'-5' RNA ligase